MKTLRALERVNNVGQVGPRSVLYLLYLKHDQMIDRVVIITKTVFIYLTIMGAAMLDTLHLSTRRRS